MQIASSVESSSLQTHFPEPFRSFVSLISIATETLLSHVLPISCLFRVNHYTRLLFMTLVPICLIGGLAAASVMVTSRHGPQASTRFFSAALLISFITLPTTSTVVFSTFPCGQLDDKKRFLLAVSDTHRSCDSSCATRQFLRALSLL